MTARAYVQVFVDTGMLLQKCELAHQAVELANNDAADEQHPITCLARARDALTSWGNALARYTYNLPNAASGFSVAQRDAEFNAAIKGTQWHHPLHAACHSERIHVLL